MAKYHNRKITVDGMTFDSTKEYRRYCELSLLERAGEITGLKRQVKYELLPPQRVGRRTVERACNYIADYVYTDSNGDIIVEDVKGFRTPEYMIKRKLMLYVHGIQIKEV